MIKKTNKRVILTMSENQYKFLERTSKKLHMSKSRVACMLLQQNISKLKEQMSNDDWEYLIEIAKTPWIE